jgi:prepilin-type N-terminal cleavage/methylation domain-containing protein
VPSFDIRPESLADAGRLRPHRAFTLLELIVTLAIIGVLLAVLLPSIRSFQRSGALASETGHARQLVMAYGIYANDHGGRLLPGIAEGLPAFDQSGAPLESAGIEHRFYVWRLAPYLDFNVKALLLDDSVLRTFSGHEYENYVYALYPSLGLNSVFLGGDMNTTANSTILNIWGPQYAERMSQVTKPVEMLVFASARENNAVGPIGTLGIDRIEGHHQVAPPFLFDREWDDTYQPDCVQPDCLARHFGYLSLRHLHRSAVVAFLEGHTGTLNEVELQDMRHWSHKATNPAWTIPPP